MASLGQAPSHDIFNTVPDPDNEFTRYIRLIGVQAQVCETREAETLFSPAIQLKISTLLLAWYQTYVRFHSTYHSSRDSPFCLMILHSTFLSLFSNIRHLEIALGRH